MGILKNARHEKFAIALLKGMSQTDAAIEAGYKPSRAYETSSRLVRNGNIIARRVELQSKVASDAVMSALERKERLSEIARARLIDFIQAGADGAYITVGPESLHNAALKEVRSRTEYNSDGANAAVITELKLHDPVKSIAELNKMDNIGVEGGKTINIITKEVYIDAREKLTSSISRLATRIRETEDTSQSE